MPRRSAGLLMYRRRAAAVEVLLVHPGGPYWARRDLGVWSLPKGEIAEGEEPLAAAEREFREETGFEPQGPYVPLGLLRQSAGKQVEAWAFEGDCDPATLDSAPFEMEWPPGSGHLRAFPEADRAAWFDLPEARRRILKGQTGFLDALQRILAAPGPRSPSPRTGGAATGPR